MRLGQAIKTFREQRELTLEELAYRADTTKSSVSRIENDDQSPSLDMLERLAAALGVKVYQVMAAAEDEALPISAASPEENALVGQYRAMEPESRYHLEAIAAALAIPQTKKRP